MASFVHGLRLDQAAVTGAPTAVCAELLRATLDTRLERLNARLNTARK